VSQEIQQASETEGRVRAVAARTGISSRLCGLALSVAACSIACAGPAAPPAQPEQAPRPDGTDRRVVAVPGGERGLGFDDLRFAPQFGKVLVPAGHTGRLDLLDPDGFALTSIRGFSALAQFPGGHGVGATSADAGDGLIFAADRTSLLLHVVDPKSRAIVSSAHLGASPDLVRFIPSAREVWVTEPDQEQIEIFTLSAGDRPLLAHAAFLAIKGGPESLLADATRGRAYTHLGDGKTLAIDVRTRAVVAQWSNGCRGSSGAALDEAGGRLFVACAEGRVVVLDLASGGILSQAATGSSLDHIAYSPSLRHLYAPDTKAAVMSTFAVSSRGELSLLGSVATVPGTECVTTDDRGQAFLCDPGHGQILVIADRYPASGTRPAPRAAGTGAPR
jgi:hypothetical protein